MLGKYKLFVLIYLISVVSASVASLFGINVQILYRVPLLGVRWIDIGILCIIGGYLYSLNYTSNIIRKNAFVIGLCFIYVLFESIQLITSWGEINPSSQLSWFFCTLNFFILIDLLSFKIEKEKIVAFLKFFAVASSCVLLVVNATTFYSLLKGSAVIIDDDFRIGLNVEGTTESIYTSVLLSYCYAFGLYFIQHDCKPWEKVLFLSTVVSIYVSLVYSFSRGDLFTVACISILYILLFSKKIKQSLLQVATLVVLLAAFYFLFGDYLREKGYDPVEKIYATATFTMDVNSPGWDKGRSIPREYALAAWRKHFWTGVGYDDLSNYGLPEEVSTAHSGIITSLFHRGIIGTSIYVIVLALLFKNAVVLLAKLKRGVSFENDMFCLLAIGSFFWIVVFWNQEATWEKYSVGIQFLYLGLIGNINGKDLA